MKSFGCVLVGLAVAVMDVGHWRGIGATILLCLAVLMISDGEGK